MSPSHDQGDFGPRSRKMLVSIRQMHVDPLTQRELNQAWVDSLISNYDPDSVGNFVLNRVGEGRYNIIDGQHRWEMFKGLGMDDVHVPCDVYDNLSPEEEADQFLKLNHRLAVNKFASFKVAVTAGRDMETDIQTILSKLDLRATREHVAGALHCIGTLERVYRRGGPELLERTLSIVHQSFGDSGLGSTVVDGMAYVLQRYDTAIRDEEAIEALRNVRGSVGAVISRSELLHKQTGQRKGHCVAAAIVEIINRGRGGRKLQSWFKGDYAA